MIINTGISVITINWEKVRNTFQFPIAVLVSPLGAVPILYMFMLYSLTFDIAPDQLEHNRWAISTFLYIIGAFGAAYWAQSIFNGNARKRENRERRLSHIEDCITSCFELEDLTSKFLLCDKNNISAIFLTITPKISALNTSTLLFNLGTKSTLKRVAYLLTKLHNNRLEDIKNGIYTLDMSHPTVSELLTAQQRLAIDLRIAYRRIESRH